MQFRFTLVSGSKPAETRYSCAFFALFVFVCSLQFGITPLIVSIAIIAAVVGVLVWLGPKISAGSYPYVEKYEVGVKEQILIEAIESFKKNHPEYNVPSQVGLIDGRKDSSDYWYHIYFYFPQENKIVYAWTRPLSKDKTTFALVSVNDGLTLGNWKDFNKDLSRQEDKEYKKKFEERILNIVKREATNDKP